MTAGPAATLGLLLIPPLILPLPLPLPLILPLPLTLSLIVERFAA